MLAPAAVVLCKSDWASGRGHDCLPACVQAEKKVQWQAEGEGDLAALKDVEKREEEEQSEEEGEQITGGLLPQDLSKLDVAALTPLTPEVIRWAAWI